MPASRKQASIRIGSEYYMNTHVVCRSDRHACKQSGDGVASKDTKLYVHLDIH